LLEEINEIIAEAGYPLLKKRRRGH